MKVAIFMLVALAAVVMLHQEAQAIFWGTGEIGIAEKQPSPPGYGVMDSAVVTEKNNLLLHAEKEPPKTPQEEALRQVEHIQKIILAHYYGEAIGFLPPDFTLDKIKGGELLKGFLEKVMKELEKAQNITFEAEEIQEKDFAGIRQKIFYEVKDENGNMVRKAIVFDYEPLIGIPEYPLERPVQLIFIDHGSGFRIASRYDAFTFLPKEISHEEGELYI